MSFNARLINLLKTDPRFVDDEGELVLAAVQDRAWKIDRDKELLTKDGVLIVAIDDNEVFYLGVMLHEIFAEHEIHCITIVHNPRGVRVRKIIEQNGNGDFIYCELMKHNELSQWGSIKKEIPDSVATVALDNGKKGTVVKDGTRQDVKVRDIERNVVQSALSRNPFFTFATIKHYFPHLASIRDFIASDDYLGGLEITFQGNVYELDDNRSEKLAAMSGLLSQIEAEIRVNVTDYQGTRDFRRDWVHEVFKDKVLKSDAKNPRTADDVSFEHFVSAKDWFAFNTIYGTGEEKAFVRMMDRQMQKLQAQYEQIYLLRNEGHFAIYNFADGQAFQPDFVLFLRKKGGKLLMYQLFIEPKGRYLKEHDRWNEAFLKEITNEFGGKPLKFRFRAALAEMRRAFKGKWLPFA